MAKNKGLRYVLGLDASDGTRAAGELADAISRTDDTAKGAEKALRGLGVKSTEAAKRQASAEKTKIAVIEDLRRKGLITERELNDARRASERRIASINRGIGTDGQAAFDRFRASGARALRTIGSGLVQARRGVDAVSGALKAAAGAAGKVAALGTALGGGVLAAGYAAAKRTSEELKEVELAADGAGVAVGRMSEALFVFGQFGSLGADQTAKALTALTDTVSQAVFSGSQKQRAALAKLGISLDDLIVKGPALKRTFAGLDVPNSGFSKGVGSADPIIATDDAEVASRIADLVSGIADEKQRAAKITDMFGVKDAKRLLPILSQGRDGIAAMLATGKGLGDLFPTRSLEAARRAVLALDGALPTRVSERFADVAGALDPVKLAEGGGRVKDAYEVVLQFADTFAALPDDATRSALAIELFGAGVARRLLPILKRGRAELEAMGQFGKDSGVVFSEEDVRRAANFQRSTGDIADAFRGIRVSIARNLFDDFDAGITAAVNAIRASRETIVAWSTIAIRSVAETGKEVGKILRGLAADFGLLDLLGGLKPGSSLKGAALFSAEDVLPGIRSVIASFGDFRATLTNVQADMEALWARAQPILEGLLKTVEDLTPALVVVRDTVRSVVSAVEKLTGLDAATILGGLLLLKLTGIGPLIAGIAAKIVTGIIALAGAVVGGIPLLIGLAIAAIATAIYVFREPIGRFFSDLWQDIKDGAVAVWDDFVDFLGATSGLSGIIFDDLWAAARDGIFSLGGYLRDTLVDALRAVGDFFSSIFPKSSDFLSERASRASDGFGALREVLGFATGGAVPGGIGRRGHDSVPSMLMPGEYVVRTAAVGKYGRWLLDAINNMSLPGFAAGGLVVPSPAFASAPRSMTGLGGGGGGGSVSVNLMLPGGQSFTGSYRPDVARELAAEVGRLSSTRSARSPGFVR